MARGTGAAFPGRPFEAARDATGITQTPLPTHIRPCGPASSGWRREKQHHTLLVATTGGTAAARNAGPSTAACPISHSATAPIGKYISGNRGSS